MNKLKLSTILAVPVLSIAGLGMYLLQPSDAVVTKSAPKDEIISLPKGDPTIKEVAPVQPELATPPVEPPTNPTPPTPVEPIYGEDPNNPGYFKVFQKETFMRENGIAESDFQYVDKIFNQWIYKGPRDAYSLCGAEPKIKMKSSGEDYDTNPYTQMKFCIKYTTLRHGTWQNAYDLYLRRLY